MSDLKHIYSAFSFTPNPEGFEKASAFNNSSIKDGAKRLKNVLIVIMAFSGMLFVSCHHSTPKQKEITLYTHKDSISYIIGYDYGEGIAIKDLNVAEDALIKGLLDGLKGETSLPDSTINQLVVRFQQEIDEREDSLMKVQIEKNKALGQEYLLENKKQAGVVELENGLQYKLVKAGQGNSPAANDSVTIHFRAMFLDGTTFDMSYDSGPAGVRLSKMIRGLSQGIQLMKPGAIYEFTIPWYLAYGDRDFANIIPGGSTLRYHVELINIVED
jgi:FKBP-type peptidyl-prolyl cis-trans isomerase